MRKRLFAMVLSVAAMLILSTAAFAASPPIEIMNTSISTNSAGGVSPTVYFRNNTGKTIKYIDFTLVPINAVNDVVRCDIRGYSSAVCQITGPIEPFSMDLSTDSAWTSLSGKTGSPFETTLSLSSLYYVSDGSYVLWVRELDKYGNPFIERTTDNINEVGHTQAYLTDDEIQNASYGHGYSWDCVWYNWSIQSIVVTKASVTFMDGTKQTYSQKTLYSGHYRTKFTNDTYENILKKYNLVYDYNYYKENNADLVASLGDNQWKYLEHFINSGMKEGRQGNSEFNLAAYKANNPDLVALFGDDNVKYYEHYIAGGKAEGRKAA